MHYANRTKPTKKPIPIVENRQKLLVNWKICADIAYISADIVCLVVEIGCGLPDELGNAEHLRRTEAAGGDSGRADAHARGDERTFRVVRDGILVGGDVHLVQTALQLVLCVGFMMWLNKKRGGASGTSDD